MANKIVFTTEHTEITEKTFLIQIVISVNSVLSVVNFSVFTSPAEENGRKPEQGTRRREINAKKAEPPGSALKENQHILEDWTCFLSPPVY